MLDLAGGQRGQFRGDQWLGTRILRIRKRQGTSGRTQTGTSSSIEWLPIFLVPNYYGATHSWLLAFQQNGAVLIG
ncbi:hypothetical protein N657DRAFT_151673 [Parathielavia appendiculata]|uniref:Uncharacterized protein n=1 Tax=Parathielavia appendiculata TaxID=2587402 RepID=A0AAN6TTW9_9PEZI|nr:hypothetical protein N657DRAFT_151673 [Parathielavia appendiculata]